MKKKEKIKKVRQRSLESTHPVTKLGTHWILVVLDFRGLNLKH